MRKEKRVAIGEHLEELRKRMIYSLILVVILSLAGYFFRVQILEILVRPMGFGDFISRSQIPHLRDALRQFLDGEGAAYFTPQQINALATSFQRLLYMQTGLVFLHPTEAFFSYIKLAVFTGTLVGMPFIIFQIWCYILPALYSNERKYFRNSVAFGTLLFFVGVAFAFIIVIPVAIRFLTRIGGDRLQAFFSVSNYIGFSMVFLLVFGVIFELPIVIFVLVRLGVISRAFLKANRKYIVVLAFVAAAILTPPDPFTQLVMAVPILLLYELGILLARFAERSPASMENEKEVTP